MFKFCAQPKICRIGMPLYPPYGGLQTFWRLIPAYLSILVLTYFSPHADISLLYGSSHSAHVSSQLSAYVFTLIGHLAFSAWKTVPPAYFATEVLTFNFISVRLAININKKWQLKDSLCCDINHSLRFQEVFKVSFMLVTVISHFNDKFLRLQFLLL